MRQTLIMSKFKGVRITWNGVPLRDVYPHATKWEMFKYRFFRAVRRTLQVTFAGVGIMAVLGIAFLIGKNEDRLSPELVAIVAQPVYAGETMQSKVDALKDRLLDEMVACENPTHLLVNPDDNKAGTLPFKDKVSIGDLQFKLSTIQHMYKVLHGVSLSDREALQLGLDTKKARELALEAWINIKGSVNQWSCATDEMRTQIADIRFLTK